MSWWCAVAFFASPPCSLGWATASRRRRASRHDHHRRFLDICGIASHMAGAGTGSAFDAKTLWIETTTIERSRTPAWPAPLKSSGSPQSGQSSRTEGTAEMAIQPPDQGFIFWPVGTGDSTTIRVAKTVYLQIDLRHMAKSEDDEDTAWPVIDELIDILPTLDGEPFLSIFVLTHPDLDHCQGFEELNDRVLISEIWMSPRTFREIRDNDDLCDDAQAFHDEAMRRVEATIDADGDPGRGDRIRIIGYDALLEETDFQGFPKEFLSVPGQTITTLDGQDLSEAFEAFVHAPFKADSFGDRNECSLAFQITLCNGNGVGRALLMGDLNYPVIRRIFECSDAETLSWNVFLAPHHCSKSVMYWKDEDDSEETLKPRMVQDIGNAALDPGYVVSSSEPVPVRNEPGDNPPHAKAKRQYERITPNEFLCTHEHPDEENPRPIIFEVGETGFTYVGGSQSTKSINNALKAAGGAAVPPATAVGFGRGAE